jgi:hypothetical protein
MSNVGLGGGGSGGRIAVYIYEENGFDGIIEAFGGVTLSTNIDWRH